MATKRNGGNDGASKINNIMDKLSEKLSQNEIRNICGNSLLALDPAGIERTTAGLEAETAAALRKILNPGTSRKTKAPHRTRGKILEEWNSAWADWDACISETTDKSGDYVLQDYHWEPPYLDKTAFAEDLEPIAARMLPVLSLVFEQNPDSRFAFTQALLNTAEEIGSDAEYIEDSGEGLAFGPKVTRCLLEWEWKRAQRDCLGAFEFLDGICEIEYSGEDIYLDYSVVGDFILSLEPGIQKEMLRGIVENHQSGHWALAFESVYGGWFALYKELCRKWDPDRFLEVCRKGVSQDWTLSLPVIDDLIARKAFREAVVLAREAASSLLRLREGELWDPRERLVLTERSFPYDGEKDRTIPALLKRWSKAARALGENDTACSLKLQLAVLDHWTNGDAVVRAFQSVPGCFQAIGDRLFKDWRSMISVKSVESETDEFSESDHGWIRSLIDAIRTGAGGPAMFERAVLGWLDQTGKTQAFLHHRLQSLAVLTLDLDSGSEVKKASQALHLVLSRECRGDRRLQTLRRSWLKRMRAGKLLPKVIQFWKRNAAQFLPDPKNSGGDYLDCTEWLAVLRDFDPSACAKVLKRWKLAHGRRRNLWKALKSAKLIPR